MRDWFDQPPALEMVRDTWRLTAMAIRLAWESGPGYVVPILVLIVVEAALGPAMLFFTRGVLDRLALDLQLAPSPDALITTVPLGVWIALAAAVVALGQFIQPLASTLQTIVGEQLGFTVRERLMRAVDRWPGIARFEDPTFVDDLDRARRHAVRGGLELMQYGTRAGIAVVMTIVLALLLATLHPLVPIVLIGLALPYMTRVHAYRQRTGSHIYVQTPDTRRLQVSRELVISPEPAKDVRLYGLGAFFRRRYDDIFQRAVVTLDRLRFGLAQPMMLSSALSALAAGASYVYLVWLVSQGARSVGDLALYGGAILMLRSQLNIIGFDLGFLPMIFQFLPSLERVLASAPDLPVRANPRPVPRPLREGVVFDRVTFAYPGSTAPVLQELSLAVRPGECLALVGHNGAGKTTLIKLLLRLYDPTAGRILLDGTDLRDYDPVDLRRAMGVIFQDFVRYELPVRHNIGLGLVEALGDDQRLLDAASRAGARELIANLPGGMETALGRELGGRELSGGEWQKIALARAFVRDADILVLDEPTASLDIQTEYDLYRRFHELTRGRTTVLISHRFSTVRMADRIVYLEGGRVAEEGSHQELLSRDGKYAHLYRLQAASYQKDSVGT